VIQRKLISYDLFSLPKGCADEPWWTAIAQIADGVTHLGLRATGEWIPMKSLKACGPNGRFAEGVPDDRLVITDCLAGALIGRIGGSSASLKVPTPVADTGEGKPFAVGAEALIKLPDKGVGPLFFGFNILARPIEISSLEVEIRGWSIA
jgi:hypothetical protein